MKQIRSDTDENDNGGENRTEMILSSPHSHSMVQSYGNALI
jgi:hypothetical protein